MPRYSHIKAFERKTIRKLLDMGCSTAKIAYVLERSRSTIHRELERNSYLNDQDRLCYDPEYAQKESIKRKAKAGYGKGYRRKVYGKTSPFYIGFNNLSTPPYIPQLGRSRFYWVHEFRIRKKDLRKYCALTYSWNSNLGRIWRKKYKQKRYIYSQPPVFPSQRPNRKRPLYYWLTDHQDFRTWKKRQRKLRIYSWLELEVMKMCRKKRVRKKRQLHTPLLYNWPKRFWEEEELWETRKKKTPYAKPRSTKILSKKPHTPCQLNVFNIQHRKTTPEARHFEPVLKICA